MKPLPSTLSLASTLLLFGAPPISAQDSALEFELTQNYSTGPCGGSVAMASGGLGPFAIGLAGDSFCESVASLDPAGWSNGFHSCVGVSTLVAADGVTWASYDPSLQRIWTGFESAGTLFSAGALNATDVESLAMAEAETLDRGWLAVGIPSEAGDTGRVNVYRNTAPGFGAYAFHSTLTAFNGLPGDRFGEAVSVYAGPERDVIVVGAPERTADVDREGTVYFYVYNDVTDVWDFNAWWWINTPVGRYGAAVTVEGDRAWAGAPTADVESVDSGYANWFEWNGSFYDWIDGVFGGAGNRVGSSLAMDGDAAVVGLPGGDGPDGSKVDVGGAAILRWDGSTYNVETPVFYPIDGAAGDAFGSAMDADGGFVTIGSPGNDTVPMRIYDIATVDGMATASAEPYFGSLGLNPNAFDAVNTPRMGTTWTPSTDTSQFGPLILNSMSISTAPASLALGTWEILIDVVAPNPIFQITGDPVSGDFAVPISSVVEHVGLTFYCQAAVVDTAINIEFLDPAYEITFGY